MSTLFACRLSLIAFATAALRGVMTGGQFEGTLKTSLLAAAAFYMIGLVCGEVARRVVEDGARSEIDRMIAEQNTSNN